jgi:hypothetical protein
MSAAGGDAHAIAAALADYAQQAGVRPDLTGDAPTYTFTPEQLLVFADSVHRLGQWSALSGALDLVEQARAGVGAAMNRAAGKAAGGLPLVDIPGTGWCETHGVHHLRPTGGGGPDDEG